MVGKSASGFEHLTRGNQTSYSSLAQSVEHLTVNQGVAGSSPAGGANENHAKWRGFFVGSPSCTRTLHPARQRRGQGAEFLLKFCRREPQGSKFVAWFDVQKRASTMRVFLIPSLSCEILFFSCVKIFQKPLDFPPNYNVIMVSRNRRKMP